MDKFLIINPLGSGAFGVVYRAAEKTSGNIVAIKRLKEAYSSWNQCLNLREVKILMKLRHPNIIKLIEVIQENGILYLVFDYMDSDLFQIMDRRRGNPFSEAEIKHWCLQTFLGLAHMHQAGYFHRDLKPENLLINKYNVVKIADFGQAREIDSNPPYTQYVATRWYRAPESMLTSGKYSPKVDMWAMGAIIAELFNLDPLFKGKTDADQMFQICKVIGRPNFELWPEGIQLANAINYKFPPFSAASLSQIIPSASREAISLIRSLLCWDPCKRLTAFEALQHPFFSSCYTITTPPQWSIIQHPIESEKKIASSTTEKQLVDYKEANELLKKSGIYVPPAGAHRTDYGAIGRRKKQTLEESLATFAL